MLRASIDRSLPTGSTSAVLRFHAFMVPAGIVETARAICQTTSLKSAADTEPGLKGRAMDDGWDDMCAMLSLGRLMSLEIAVLEELF